ncbi:MAG: manganese efflux pump [Clostridiales bacterium]|nr:manganese efflux pump [Clostridiales bacterium]
MDFLTILLTAVALSMDAFAVSVCKGLSLKKVCLKSAGIVGLWFGGFQALMPLIGYFVGVQFRSIVDAYTHWIAFALLAIIGINMIREALSEEEDQETACACGALSAKAMFPMAIATSIDALAVGVSFAMGEAGDGMNIFAAVAMIGVITCLLSMIGVKMGSIFGAKYEKKAEILGGVILILLGVKILLEHFGVL